MFEKLEAFFVIGLIRLVGLLPLSAARSLGAGLGKLSILFNANPVRVTDENLRLAYPEMPEEERKVLTRKSIIETGKLATEIFTVSERNYHWLSKRIVNVTGKHLLDKLRNEDRGIVVLGPHIGNWEVLGLYMNSVEPIVSLYQKPKAAYLEHYTKKTREKSGAILVPTNQRGLAKLIGALKKGKMTGILPDQVPYYGGGEIVPFFAEPALTMTFVYKLIQKTHCAVIFALAKRVPDGFEIIFYQAPDEIYSNDIRESTCALSKGIEEAISYCPEQYQWEYKRYKKNGKILYKKQDHQ